jgi:hypothetical protein
MGGGGEKKMMSINKFDEYKLQNLSLICGGDESSNVVDYNSLSEAEKRTVVFEDPDLDYGKKIFGRTNYTDGCGHPRRDVTIFFITIKINPDCNK